MTTDPTRDRLDWIRDTFQAGRTVNLDAAIRAVLDLCDEHEKWPTTRSIQDIRRAIAEKLGVSE